MGIILKQSIKSSIYTYVGAILGFVNIGLLWPKYLTPGQIGTLMLLVSFSTIFARLGTLGFQGAIVRFYPQFRDRPFNGGWPILILLVALVGTLIFLGIYLFVSPILIENNSDKSPELANYFYLIIPLTIFQILFFELDSFSTVLYRSTIGILLKELIQRLLILLGIILLIVHYLDYEKYVYWYVSSICMVTLLLLFDLIIKKDFSLKGSLKEFSGEKLKEMAKFSGYGFINGFSGPAIQNIDRIMINAFVNSAATGIYGVTFHFGSLVSMPSRGLLKIASTMLADAHQNDDRQTIKDIYYKSCINQYIIGLWVFLGIWCNIDNVFQILPSEYQDGKYVIFFIGLTQVVRMANGVNDGLINYSKYFRFITLFLFIFLALVVVYNAVFIPIYGLTGAAFASFLAIVCYLGIKWYFIKVKFQMQPYNLKFLWVTIIALLTYFVVDFIPILPHFIADILVRSILITVIYLSIIYALKLSEDINLLIIKSIETAKRYVRKII